MFHKPKIIGGTEKQNFENENSDVLSQSDNVETKDGLYGMIGFFTVWCIFCSVFLLFVCFALFTSQNVTKLMCTQSSAVCEVMKINWMLLQYQPVKTIPLNQVQGLIIAERNNGSTLYLNTKTEKIEIKHLSDNQEGDAYRKKGEFETFLNGSGTDVFSYRETDIPILFFVPFFLIPFFMLKKGFGQLIWAIRQLFNSK